MAESDKCDICHKPLKPGTKRHVIATIFRPDLTLTVGPECARKERKARKEALARHTPEEIEMMRAKIAAHTTP